MSKHALLKNCTGLHSLKHDRILRSMFGHLNAMLLSPAKSRPLLKFSPQSSVVWARCSSYYENEEKPMLILWEEEEEFFFDQFLHSLSLCTHDQSYGIYTRTHVFIVYLCTVNLSFLVMQCKAVALNGPMSCRTRDDFFLLFYPSSRLNDALSAPLSLRFRSSES